MGSRIRFWCVMLAFSSMVFGVEAARGQGNVGGDADIAGGNMLHDPVIGGIRPVRHI